jgi:hypothetical protein
MNAALIKRLEKWLERVRTDTTLPWLGLGVIRDVEEAIRILKNEEYDL